MAFLRVQDANTSGTNTTQNLTVSSTILNNIVIGGLNTDDISQTLTSITDDKGNTYVVDTATTHNSRFLYMFYGVQVTGGVTTITANKSGSVFSRMTIIEFSGNGTTNASTFDTEKTGTGAGTDLSVSTLTPAASGELIVSFGLLNNFLTWTAGAGYTLENQANPEQLKGQYKLSGTTSETAPMKVVSDSFGWGEHAKAFKGKAVLVKVSSTLSVKATSLLTVQY